MTFKNHDFYQSNLKSLFKKYEKWTTVTIDCDTYVTFHAQWFNRITVRNQEAPRVSPCFVASGVSFKSSNYFRPFCSPRLISGALRDLDPGGRHESRRKLLFPLDYRVVSIPRIARCNTGTIVGIEVYVHTCMSRWNFGELRRRLRSTPSHVMIAKGSKWLK